MQSGSKAGGNYAEIDMCEPNGCQTYHQNNPTETVKNQPSTDGNFNCGTYATRSGTYAEKAILVSGLPDLSANYHTYSMIYKPEHVQLFIDGNKYAEFYNENVPAQGMQMFLTHQIDGTGCKPNSTTWVTSYWYFKNFKYLLQK